MERIIKNHDERKTMIPHNTEENIEKTEIGTWAGLAVYPYIELSSSCAINHKQISNRTCYDKQASRQGDICLTRCGSSLAGEGSKKIQHPAY